MSGVDPRRAVRALLLLLPLGLALPAESLAQSLYANRGLGLLVQPMDARATALGGVGLGLPGGEMSWANPADLAGLPAGGLKAVFQMSSFDAEIDGRSHDGSTARFPMIMGAFPAGERWVVAVGYAALLDQNWSIEQADTLVLGPDTVPITDRLRSEGGVAQLRVGASYAITPPLSVGASLDLYTGSSQRQFGRLFGSVPPGCCTVEWRYSGLGATLGGAWSATDALRLSASASYGGTLEATPDSAGIAESSFSMPLVLRAGASGRIAQEALIAASLEWGGWGSLDGDLGQVGGARDAISVGGGVEWEGLSVRGRTIPIRLGARYAALPFSWSQPGTEFEFPDELAGSAGLGLVLGGGAARADLTYEAGRRGSESAGVAESFSRFVFSISALGR